MQCDSSAVDRKKSMNAGRVDEVCSRCVRQFGAVRPRFRLFLWVFRPAGEVLV